MKNENVIEMFIDGATRGKTTNLRIEGDKLINYGTAIAEREYVNGEYRFTLNMTKYSSSTSRIQSKMNYLMPQNRVDSVVANIPMGCTNLL